MNDFRCPSLPCDMHLLLLGVQLDLTFGFKLSMELCLYFFLFFEVWCLFYICGVHVSNAIVGCTGC